MSVTRKLAEKEQERTGLIEKATDTLARDSRVVAAWLAGSLGRGDADAYSDIDLWVVVRDEDMEAVRKGRRQFVEVLGTPILISEAPQNAPPGGAYLLTMYTGRYGPQHIDWNWLPQSTAAIPPDVQLLFDHVGLPVAPLPRIERPHGDELAAALTQECAFFWAMCAVVAKYIARRKRYNVLALMDIVTGTGSKIQWLLGEGDLRTYRDSIWDEVPLLPEPVDQLGLLSNIASYMESVLNPMVEAVGGMAPYAAIAEARNLFGLVNDHLQSAEEQS